MTVLNTLNRKDCIYILCAHVHNTPMRKDNDYKRGIRNKFYLFKMLEIHCSLFFKENAKSSYNLSFLQERELESYDKEYKDFKKSKHKIGERRL